MLSRFIEPISSNPFGLIGLPANATADQISQAVNTARIETRLSDSDNNEAQLDSILRAESNLLDPMKRLVFECGWFYSVPKSLLDDGDADAQATLLDFQEQSRWTGNAGVQAKHDLAQWLL